MTIQGISGGQDSSMFKVQSSKLNDVNQTLNLEPGTLNCLGRR